jgi:hypothetical protein
VLNQEAEFELHGTVSLFSRFLSGVVKSVCKERNKHFFEKLIYAYILHIRGFWYPQYCRAETSSEPIIEHCERIN